MAADPPIHGKGRALSASSILVALGDDLSAIKSQDRLTFADIGRILGKSDDQAAKYCDGTAEMGVIAYTFARDQWNGRITGTLDALVASHAPVPRTDRSRATIITKALLEISVALEDDEEMTPREVRANRKSLEEAKDAIEGFLAKLKVRAA